MGIQKFIVNGDEAKIDYEGLENKPFGNATEEIIYPLKTSTYTMNPLNIGRATLDFSDFTKALVAGEHYIVQFDGTVYEVDAVIDGPAVVLCNLPLDSETGFPSGAVFLVATSTGGLSPMATAMAPTAGDHSLSISKVDLSTLDPKYLPKDLQFVRENSELIMDTTTLLFEED